MGFESDRFENIVDEELICTICSGVLEDPVQIEPCEHTFCRKCITQWCTQQFTCPVDRNAINPSQFHAVPRIMRNMLGRLRIKCKNYNHGCSNYMHLDELRAHTKNCEYNPKRPVPCMRGCGLSVPKDEINSHNCARDLQKMISELKSSMQELRNVVKSQGKMLEELKHDVQQIKEFTMALKVVHPSLRVLVECSDRNEILLWSRALLRTRVSRWSNMISTPDHQSKLLIKNALMESNCPERFMLDLADNCHEQRWPPGLASQSTREICQDLLDDYICRRLPGQLALVVLSVDNGHMGEDMMAEPGITILFRNGFN